MVSSLLYYISFVTFVGSTVWTLLVYKLLCIKPTPRKYDKCVDKCTIIYTTKASGWSLITHPDQTPRTCVWCILQFNVFYFGIRLYSKNIVLPPLEFINFDKVEYFCNFDPQKMFILKLYFHILVLLLNIFGIRLYSKKIQLPPLDFINIENVEGVCNFDPPPTPKNKNKRKIYWNFILVLGYIQRKFYYHHVNSLILKKKVKSLHFWPQN